MGGLKVSLVNKNFGLSWGIWWDEDPENNPKAAELITEKDILSKNELESDYWIFKLLESLKPKLEKIETFMFCLNHVLMLL